MIKVTAVRRHLRTGVTERLSIKSNAAYSVTNPMRLLEDAMPYLTAEQRAIIAPPVPGESALELAVVGSNL